MGKMRVFSSLIQRFSFQSSSRNKSSIFLNIRNRLNYFYRFRLVMSELQKFPFLNQVISKLSMFPLICMFPQKFLPLICPQKPPLFLTCSILSKDIQQILQALFVILFIYKLAFGNNQLIKAGMANILKATNLSQIQRYNILGGYIVIPNSNSVRINLKDCKSLQKTGKTMVQMNKQKKDSQKALQEQINKLERQIIFIKNPLNSQALFTLSGTKQMKDLNVLICQTTEEKIQKKGQNQNTIYNHFQPLPARGVFYFKFSCLANNPLIVGICGNDIKSAINMANSSFFMGYKINTTKLFVNGQTRIPNLKSKYKDSSAHIFKIQINLNNRAIKWFCGENQLFSEKIPNIFDSIDIYPMIAMNQNGTSIQFITK